MRRIMDASNELITTADLVDPNELWTAYQASLDDYNSITDDIVGALSFEHTDEVSEVIQGAYEFEDYADYTLPDSHDVSVAKVYYGLKPFDLRLAYTYRRILKTPSTELDARHSAALQADKNLLVRWVLKTAFTKAGLVLEGVTAAPFYNGDTVRVPPFWKGNSFDGTHTHYLTTGAAAIGTEDLDAMEDTLAHHGFEKTIEVWINGENRREIASLADFVPAREMNHDAGMINLPGPPFFGQHGRMLIRLEDWIPKDYMFAFSRQGGKNSPQNPIGVRQALAPAARGLKLVRGDNPAYPLINSFYYHEFGPGVRQFGNGVVMQRTASGTYTSPAL